MSILDKIASPIAPNYLKGLRLMENIETSRTNRRIAEIQAGQALQQMQARRLQTAQRAIGLQTIREEFLKPDPSQKPVPANRPMSDMQINEQITDQTQPKAQERQRRLNDVKMRPIYKGLQNLPSNEITNSTSYINLGEKLLGIPGMEKTAKFLIEMGNQSLQRYQDMNETELAQRDAQFERLGNLYEQVSKLEEQGQFTQAEKIWNQNRKFLLSDPLFADDPDTQQFFDRFGDYEPGKGKFVYYTTMYGKKGREQFLSTKPKPTKYDALNLLWPGQDRPVKGRFNDVTGTYEYEKDGRWLKAPDDAEILGRTTIQGTAADVGLTKRDVSKLNQQIVADDMTVDMIDKIIQGIEENPSSIGFVGNVKELSAGLIGQFGSMGSDIAGMIESENEIQVRSGIRMLTGLLIPRVLNDTSGRYSDRDIERVDEINRGLKNLTSSQQAITTLKEVKQIIVNGQNSSKKMLNKDAAEQYSQEDLEYTAKKHNLTVEQVKQQLGIK